VNGDKALTVDKLSHEIDLTFMREQTDLPVKLSKMVLD
jgi:hypothetical protein